MKVENVKVRYLFSPGLPQQVLTIAFSKRESRGIDEDDHPAYFVDYQFALNRIVTPKQLLLDQRLRGVMTKQEFNELQKKFKKHFRSDQHNRKVAHRIAIGRLLGNPHTVPCESKDGYEEVLHAMLDWAQKNDKFKYKDILYSALGALELEKRNKDRIT